MEIRKPLFLISIVSFILISVAVAIAQTSAFTYQGKLTEGSVAANGAYDFRFRIFDEDGTPIGPDVLRDDVTVTAGNFTVRLDFGAAQFLDSSAVTLEIAVRPGSSTGTYTPLTPRELLTSTPYAIKSLNSTQLGGIASDQYVVTTDPRMTDARVPTAGSGDYIQNTTGLQSDSKFNISGNGFVGGNFGVGTTAAAHRLALGPGGPAWTGHAWTGSVELPNAGAIGWRPNSNSQSYGIGQTNWGLSFFRTGAPLGGGFPGLVPNYALNIDNSGRVGIGGSTGIGSNQTLAQLHVTGEGRTGIYSFAAPSGFYGVFGESTNGGGVFGKSANGAGVVGTSGPWIGVYGESNTYQGVHGKSTTNVGVVGVGNSMGGVYGESANGNGLWGKSTNGLAVFADGNMHVNGWTRTRILEITGGSDLAENFEFAYAQVKPGMVVAIDTVNPGKLVLARGAYNRRVAGIISGANNLSAGMVLPDLKNSKNALPVTLAGRVWVYADATKKQILPGDLLTTSPTDGHAMKVINHRRAQGAVIGKAMSGLKSGRGLVLVLVSLQ